MPTNTGKSGKIAKDLDGEMGGVRMGVNVDIKRSDGKELTFHTGSIWELLGNIFRVDKQVKHTNKIIGPTPGIPANL